MFYFFLASVPDGHRASALSCEDALTSPAVLPYVSVHTYVFLQDVMNTPVITIIKKNVFILMILS
ncbi:MAG: hypothetical protein C0448_15575 [Sphingobacteriaceae bacterium]|nr:hypothetical protein [Sphingobacteriaceae bacterium]